MHASGDTGVCECFLLGRRCKVSWGKACGRSLSIRIIDMDISLHGHVGGILRDDGHGEI